jgi:hypothetical protein
VARGSHISIPPVLDQAEMAPGPAWVIALVVVAADSGLSTLLAVGSLLVAPAGLGLAHVPALAPPPTP